MQTLSSADVIAIHDSIIGDHELQGIAQHKSIDAILARVNTRMAYGMINDIYELAACYACYIAVGHAFNDANKRTAFACMHTCFILNGIKLPFDQKIAGDMMIRAAQKQLDETDIAQWLRELHLQEPHKN